MAHEDAIDLDALPAAGTERPAELCALDDALTLLTTLDPRRARVIELRFFGGLSVEGTAEALGGVAGHGDARLAAGPRVADA